MTKVELYEILEKKILILDGATGTELQKRGMPGGVCPEEWVIQNPDVIKDVQRTYIESGSDLVYACTFGANRLKLSEFNLQDKVYEMNKRLAQISREAVGDKKLVAGDIAPTGQFVEPFGSLGFEEAVDVYKEQVKGLYDGGVDLFVIETMIDIQEMRAALIAVKEVCDLPVITSMTYGEDGYTLTGTDPVSALITLQSLGAAVVGCNCSTGPDKMLEVIKKMKPYAKVPLMAKPNAGLPKLVGNETVFDMKPDEFASFAGPFADAGVNLFGGCCGTSPEYIKEVSGIINAKSPVKPYVKSISALSSARSSVVIQKNHPLLVIGERINPTGKKKFQQILKEGRLDEVKRIAFNQQESNAALLDVNMGMPGIDENDMMLKSIKMLATATTLPLVIDSSDPAVIENALRIYPGRALINSISLEDAKQPLFDVAKKYGAMFILLPLSDEGIPTTCEQRIDVLNKIMENAGKYEFSKNDIIVDALIMTVSSDQKSAGEILKFIRWCTDNDFYTTGGLSNVSFGLPERKWVNAAFMAMAINSGMTTAIANPNEQMLMNIKYASDVLTSTDQGSRNYIQSVVKIDENLVTSNDKEKSIFNSVVNGDDTSIVGLIKEELEKNPDTERIVNEMLIPAIRKVGDLYDKKVYFLPQLIAGADTMKKAFSYLEPLLESKGVDAPEKDKIIMATVKGDIHDIGKNIVSIMMKNYGYDVIDLGKDVAADVIVDEAIKHNAKVIGLSALMTTTMTQMKVVVDLAKSRGCKSKIIIGGAVTSDDYAKEIGADGYSKDSVEAVKLVEKLLS